MGATYEFQCTGCKYPATKHIVIYHDPKGITDEEKLRISVGITIAGDVPVGGEIGKLSISKGRYMMCRFELGNDEWPPYLAFFITVNLLQRVSVFAWTAGLTRLPERIIDVVVNLFSLDDVALGFDAGKLQGNH